jgi:hypothetical protein
MKYLKLYVNGCSFTAGDSLTEKEIWPYHLSKKLNLELVNHSMNGNSMQSIAYNSVNYLSTLDPKETTVVIGLTWPTRFMVSLLDCTVSVTPATFGREDVLIGRRVLPYNLKHKEGKYEGKDYEKSISVVKKFAEYYKDQLIDNKEQLLQNQLLTHYTHIVYLQSFLEVNKFNYTFVKFGSFSNNQQIEDSSPYPIFNKIDQKKIIKLEDNKYSKSPTNHPTAEQCKEISNIIFNVIK